MAERRDAADGKAGDVAHVLRIRPPQRLADALRHGLLVDAVGAGDQQQIGLARLGARGTPAT